MRRDEKTEAVLSNSRATVATWSTCCAYISLGSVGAADILKWTLRSFDTTSSPPPPLQVAGFNTDGVGSAVGHCAASQIYGSDERVKDCTKPTRSTSAGCRRGNLNAYLAIH